MLRRWAGFAVAAFAAGVVVVPASNAAASTTGDPAQNVAPSPSYWRTCSQQGKTSQGCTDAVVAAIDNARLLEGVGPMTLPSGFASLSPPQQTFVVTNLERVDRGLPPVAGMVESLNTLATTAAGADADPMLSGWTVDTFRVDGWSSIWAGDLNALAADYDWMYNDGWSSSGSYNLDCTSPTAPGCWGHRHGILRPGANLITGVGTEQQSQWLSVAQILVSGTGDYPAFRTSWADITQATPVVPPATTDPQPTPVAKVQPSVTAWASARATGRAIVAHLEPANGQTVRLRRHTMTGWVTVRRSAANTWMTFDNVRRAHYRVVVAETSTSARAVADLRAA